MDDRQVLEWIDVNTTDGDDYVNYQIIAVFQYRVSKTVINKISKC